MMRRLELGVGLAATALLVVVHLSMFRHAGALWRDEVNSVNLATMSPEEFGRNLQFDSFPVGWFLLLRGWIASGAGTTDAGLRGLGLLMGLGTVGALWWNARRVGAVAPLVSLPLLGFNAAVVAYGDSVRAYGLGMLTAIATLGLVHRFALRPDRRSGIAAALAAVVATQCVFYNAIVVLAACAGGSAVAARRRGWRAAALPLALGLPAALSLLPYAGTMQRQSEWNAIVRWPIDLAWVAAKFRAAAAMTSALSPWLWVGLFAATIGVAAYAGARHREDPADPSGDAALFGGVTLAVGVAAYLAFLLALSYLMQPWYFLTIMALAAACFDLVWLSVLRRPAARAARLAAVVLVAGLAFPGTWAETKVRKTNLDRVAARIAAEAGADDLIVVTPWTHGVSFARHFRGVTPWTTIPPMDSHLVHRYDLLRRAMTDPAALRPLLERLDRVLRGGHRVYWVGTLEAPPPGVRAPVLPPAPEGPWGWREGPRYEAWGLEAGAFLRDRARRAIPVPVAVERPVSSFEDLSLTVLDSRREPAP